MWLTVSRQTSKTHCTLTHLFTFHAEFGNSWAWCYWVLSHMFKLFKLPHIHEQLFPILNSPFTCRCFIVDMTAVCCITWSKINIMALIEHAVRNTCCRQKPPDCNPLCHHSGLTLLLQKQSNLRKVPHFKFNLTGQKHYMPCICMFSVSIMALTHLCSVNITVLFYIKLWKASSYK